MVERDPLVANKDDVKPLEQFHCHLHHLALCEQVLVRLPFVESQKVGDFDGEKGAELGEVARQLRILSGLYDQAARSATNL